MINIFVFLIFIARTKDENIFMIKFSRSTVSTTVEHKSHEQQSQNKHHYQWKISDSLHVALNSEEKNIIFREADKIWSTLH